MPDELKKIVVSDPYGSMTFTSCGPYRDENEANEYLRQRGWKNIEHDRWQAVVDSRERSAWVRSWDRKSKDSLPQNEQ